MSLSTHITSATTDDNGTGGEWTIAGADKSHHQKPSTPTSADANNSLLSSSSSWHQPRGDQSSMPHQQSASGSGAAQRTNRIAQKSHHSDTLSFTTPFTMWTFSKSQMESYDTSLKKICTFSTIPEFWHYYQYILKPSQMHDYLLEKHKQRESSNDGDDSTTTNRKSPPFPGRDIQCFRENIKPAWEDPNNRNGGKWLIRIKKEYSNRLWEELLLAFIGEQLSIGLHSNRDPSATPEQQQMDDVNEVCGIVLSVREHHIISVWNRNAADLHVRERLRDRIKNVLHLPVGTVMEYKPHQVGTQDQSSRDRVQSEIYRVSYRRQRFSDRGGNSSGRNYSHHGQHNQNSRFNRNRGQE